MSLENLLQRAARAYHRFFGTVRLQEMEKLCLEAWQASLNHDERSILADQLARVALVQRQAKGAKVCFYFEGDANSRRAGQPSERMFENRAPDQHVADVILVVQAAASGQALRVKIMVHRGRLFSLEFPKRPDRYLEQHGMKGSPLRVREVIKTGSLGGQTA